MKALYTAQATVEGGRDGTVRTRDGKLHLQLSTPKVLGGKGGEATNPEELFAAGYAACFQSALQLVAFKQKTPLPSNGSITASVDLGKLDSGIFNLAVELQIHLPGMDQQVAQELLEKAHQICPYSNATRGNIEVKLTLQTAETVGI
ncbi:organic hydroperoxide resistance protein [Deinococcus roseus]|uniref:Organic hydroperoxide resistance protein n=1 Tax=Deinococcus roseus TaxID=392414 RepID=A0ABQ2D0Q4_9DEIO|nr:organic hydroperoxide resistance protein [Deinococcus roseus]